ncbi:response regulator transcription factor [Nocardia jejuensis]|uniref:response regulator transcription factor n=1 Tax=Nocardia jejuensis TaxID=328049 RepID=UPI0008369965|nr:LuxR C-terminal-related transcriptional regulator [Nocardia jejuensis]
MRFLERTEALEALSRAWEEVAAGRGTVAEVSVDGERGLVVRAPETVPEPPGPGVPRLTGRQQDVLDLLCAGLTNVEMAEYLVLSVRTVDHHVSAVLRKLGVTNRRAARALALNQPVPQRTSHVGRPRTALSHGDSTRVRVLHSA